MENPSFLEPLRPGPGSPHVRPLGLLMHILRRRTPRRLRAFLLLPVLTAALSVGAEVLVWTNTAGGSWNTPGNWSPNRVPTLEDVAILTNAGLYAVTLKAEVTLAGLTVGGSAGTQTLATAGNTLTLNGEGEVNPNGCLILTGTLSGTNQVKLSGTMTLESGGIDTHASIHVDPGGSIILESSGNHVKNLWGRITNGGIVTWRMYGNLAIAGTLHNLPGGRFEAQITNRSIVKTGDGAIIVNEGLFRKSAGPGELGCSVPMHNRGRVETSVGTLTLAGGSVQESGATFWGAGLTRLDTGIHVLDGDLHGTNLVIGGDATLTGNATLRGAVTWASGTLSSGSALTVAAGAQMLLSSPGNNHKTLLGSLTNAGTIIFSPYGSLEIGGTMHNLPGGLFEVRTTYNSISPTGETALIVNEGVFRRSSTTSTVVCGVPVINRGRVEAVDGTLAFTERFDNPSGTVALAGGSLSFSRPLLLEDGLLTGWGPLIADVTNGGCILPSGSNSVLAINGSYEQLPGGRLEFGLAGDDPVNHLGRLHITGAAGLHGTLGIVWAGAGAPAPDTTFPLLSFRSRRGEFCCFDHCFLLGQNRRLIPVYSHTNLTLATLAVADPTNVPLSLSIRGDALVCWPAEFVGCELYRSTDLNLTNWAFIPGATNRYLRPLPLAAAEFFRLRQP